ncbi:MAG TPA: MAPEG family protein [Gammaproteobacteria bacterium]|nr:MAPEG family protein [Gammaproteobacteria bacterium]
MPEELYWLTLTVLMTALMWVPYILNWIREQGLVQAVWPGDTFDHSQPRAAWALRALRAHENAVENLVIFAPLVLTLHALDVSSPATTGASAVYFFTRAAHYLVFTLGIPLLRVLTFAVGVMAQLVLATTLLRHMSA